MQTVFGHLKKGTLCVAGVIGEREGLKLESRIFLTLPPLPRLHLQRRLEGNCMQTERTLRNPSEGGWTAYVVYITEILSFLVLFQTEKEVSKIKLGYASIADHLLHSSYPYPLDQRELVDKNDNF